MIVVAIAALPAVVALVLWAVTRLETFLLFGVLAANIVPVSLAKPFGANIAAVDVLLLLAGLAWFIKSSQRDEPLVRPDDNPVLRPSLALVAVSALSLLWSIKPRSTLIFTVQLIEITLITPMLFAAVPSSLRNVRNALGFLIAGTTVLSLIAISIFAIHPSSGGTNLPGWNKNALGSYAAAAAVMSYALALGQRQGRRVFTATFLINITGTVASVSRGAIIGACVALAVTTLLLGRGRFVSFTIVALVAVLATAVLSPVLKQKTAIAGGYDTSQVRVYAWADAVKKIEQNPFLGTGGKTYSDNVSQLHDLYITDPTNMFLLTWSELGILGMMALIFILYRFSRLVLELRSLEPNARALAIGAAAVTISYFVHFQVDVTWTRGTTTMAFAMIGLMAAIQRIATARTTGGIGNHGPGTSLDDSVARLDEGANPRLGPPAHV